MKNIVDYAEKNYSFGFNLEFEGNKYLIEWIEGRVEIKKCDRYYLIILLDEECDESYDECCGERIEEVWFKENDKEVINVLKEIFCDEI